MSELTDNIINTQFLEKALKSYMNQQRHQYKYNHTENGLKKRREASRRYYNKMKDDPEFLLKQNNKVKAYLAKKKLQNEIKNEQPTELVI